MLSAGRSDRAEYEVDRRGIRAGRRGPPATALRRPDAVLFAAGGTEGKLPTPRYAHDRWPADL
jgi:hypothetical protein